MSVAGNQCHCADLQSPQQEQFDTFQGLHLTGNVLYFYECVGEGGMKGRTGKQQLQWRWSEEHCDAVRRLWLKHGCGCIAEVIAQRELHKHRDTDTLHRSESALNCPPGRGLSGCAHIWSPWNARRQLSLYSRCACSALGCISVAANSSGLQKFYLCRLITADSFLQSSGACGRRSWTP